MKKKIIKSSMISVATAVVLAVTGCGGSSSSSNNNSTKTSGKAVDPYITNATVFFDMNANGEFDSGEPHTETDINGSYTLPISDDIKNAADPKAGIVVTGGKDGGDNFIGSLKAPVDGNNINITPLTTLVAAAFENFVTDDKTIEDAYKKVSAVLGISNPKKLKDDPIAKKDKTLISTSIAIHKTIVLMKQAASNSTDTTKFYEALGEGIAKGIAKANVGVGNLFKAVANDPTIAKELPKAAITIAQADVATSIQQAVANSVANDVKIDTLAKVVKTLTKKFVKVVELAKSGASVDTIKKAAETAKNEVVKSSSSNSESSDSYKSQLKLSGLGIQNGLSVNLETTFDGNGKFSPLTLMRIKNNIDDNNISKYNLKLTGIDLNKSSDGKYFDAQDVNLSIRMTSIANEYNLTIPVKMQPTSDGNLSLSIAKGTHFKLDTNDSKCVSKEFNMSEASVDFNSTSGVLVIDMNRTIYDSNDSATLESNLSQIIKTVDTYKMHIGFVNVDNSKIAMPIQNIDGNISVTDTPELTFGGIEINNTNKGNVYKAFSSGAFDQLDLNTTGDDNISDYNLTLSDISMSKAFESQNGRLGIELKGSTNLYKLSIPVTIKPKSDTDLNLSLSIAQDAIITFETNDTKDVNQTFKVSKLLEFNESALEDNNLTIDMKTLISETNDSSAFESNLSRAVDHNETYKMSIEFDNINSKVYFKNAKAGKDKGSYNFEGDLNVSTDD